VKLRFSCPQCGRTNRANAVEQRTVLACEHCDYVGLLPLDWAEDRRVARCPICGSTDLYRRRRPPLLIPIALAAAGAGLVVFTGGLSLAVAAAGIAATWIATPERLACYRCAARVTGHARDDGRSSFDPRVQAAIRRGAGTGPRHGERSDRQQA
jgi:DNA-directed RNA polymerase subunit RPC12/RpoP